MKHFGSAILWLVVVLAALPATLTAQSKKYTLSGTITDSITLLPVKNARVSVAGSAYKAIADAKGTYKIEKLIPGTNNLIVWADGYDSIVVNFEIRTDMLLNVKLMQKLDTASLHIAMYDTATIKIDSAAAKTPQKVTPPKKEKKKAAPILTEKDKEQIKVLIEDVIFSKSIYFERFKDKRSVLCVWGSFSIDTGYLYTFEAVFSKTNGYELKSFDFKMKGRHAQ